MRGSARSGVPGCAESVWADAVPTTAPPNAVAIMQHLIAPRRSASNLESVKNYLF